MYTFKDLVEITAKLRAEDGCPWDREQTFESLRNICGKRQRKQFRQWIK